MSWDGTPRQVASTSEVAMRLSCVVDTSRPSDGDTCMQRPKALRRQFFSSLFGCHVGLYGPRNGDQPCLDGAPQALHRMHPFASWRVGSVGHTPHNSLIPSADPAIQYSTRASIHASNLVEKVNVDVNRCLPKDTSFALQNHSSVRPVPRSR
jgi:hypothetical protein